MSLTAPDLASRYGVRRRGSRPLVVAAVAVLAAAALTWVAWVALFHGRPQVTSDLVGFDAADQHVATARFNVVRRDADVRATCLLRAYAADHTIVGELVVPVRSGPATRAMSAKVRTERQATSVELLGCTAPGQNQPR